MLLAALLLLSATILAVMLGMSARLARRLPADGPVPVHFDLRGNADALGSRWLILLIMPVLLVPFSGFTAWVASAAPAEAFAEKLFGHIFGGIIMLAGHGLACWLLLRWARQQGG